MAAAYSVGLTDWSIFLPSQTSGTRSSGLFFVSTRNHVWHPEGRRPWAGAALVSFKRMAPQHRSRLLYACTCAPTYVPHGVVRVLAEAEDAPTGRSATSKHSPFFVALRRRQALFDPNSNLKYYWNPSTNVTTYEVSAVGLLSLATHMRLWCPSNPSDPTHASQRPAAGPPPGGPPPSSGGYGGGGGYGVSFLVLTCMILAAPGPSSVLDDACAQTSIGRRLLHQRERRWWRWLPRCRGHGDQGSQGQDYIWLPSIGRVQTHTRPAH